MVPLRRLVRVGVSSSFGTELVVTRKHIGPNQPRRGTIDEVSFRSDIGNVLHDLECHDFLEDTRQLLAPPELYQYARLATERFPPKTSPAVSALKGHIDRLQGPFQITGKVKQTIRLPEGSPDIIRIALDYRIQQLERFTIPPFTRQETLQHERETIVIAITSPAQTCRYHLDDDFGRYLPLDLLYPALKLVERSGLSLNGTYSLLSCIEF